MSGAWDETSPLAPVRDPIGPHEALSEGPVRFLLVSGRTDSDRWGLVGAFWLTIEGHRGGFLVSPGAIWRGSEMVRSLRRAVERGWTHEEIFGYWQGLTGVSGDVWIDPQQHSDTLFEVARRVGCL
jgi:hypothetical protein